LVVGADHVTDGGGGPQSVVALAWDPTVLQADDVVLLGGRGDSPHLFGGDGLHQLTDVGPPLLREQLLVHVQRTQQAYLVGGSGHRGTPHSTRVGVGPGETEYFGAFLETFGEADPC